MLEIKHVCLEGRMVNKKVMMIILLLIFILGPGKQTQDCALARQTLLLLSTPTNSGSFLLNLILNVVRERERDR